MKNEYLNSVMKQPHLIQYVRDKFGYVKGVAVSVGKDKFGWSLVAPSDSVLRRVVKPTSIPAIAHLLRPLYKKNKEGKKVLIREAKTAEEVIKSKALLAVIAQNSFVQEPLFNREVGLTKAFRRAEAGTTAFVPYDNEALEVTWAIESHKDITDDDLFVSLVELKERAEKFFK
jgi:hypothetical protein